MIARPNFLLVGLPHVDVHDAGVEAVAGDGAGGQGREDFHQEHLPLAGTRHAHCCRGKGKSRDKGICLSVTKGSAQNCRIFRNKLK